MIVFCLIGDAALYVLDSSVAVRYVYSAALGNYSQVLMAMHVLSNTKELAWHLQLSTALAKPQAPVAARLGNISI